MYKSSKVTNSKVVYKEMELIKRNQMKNHKQIGRLKIDKVCAIKTVNRRFCLTIVLILQSQIIPLIFAQLPSAEPSDSPTYAPYYAPVESPNAQEEITYSPTETPITEPTYSPSEEPSVSPSVEVVFTTWSLTTGLPNLPLAVCMSGDGVYVATAAYDGGIYYSSDGGYTFSVSDAPTPMSWTYLACSSSGLFMVADTSDLAGNLYLSSSFGASWTALTSYADTFLQLAMSGSGAYVNAYSCSTGPGLVYRSSDFGQTFTTALPPGSPDNCGSLSSDRSDRQYFLSPNFIYKSTDFGNSWSQLSSLSSQLDWTSVTFDASASLGLAVYSDGESNSGVVYSTDGGSNWQESSLPEAQGFVFIAALADSNTGQFVTAAARDGYVYTSSDYGANFVRNNPTEGTGSWNQLAVDAAGTRLFVTTMGADSSGGYSYVGERDVPTPQPSVYPTQTPDPSQSPYPSTEPTVSPTELPIESPTESPSASPTAAPSVFPSQSPSASPSMTPSASPTQSPSMVPSTAPTVALTDIPTESPSDDFSSSPTQSLSIEPSQVPTIAPSVSPSLVPSLAPTFDEPTELPSASPIKTSSPVLEPTAEPSLFPTHEPSVAPTIVPTVAPSIVSPTLSPTAYPTLLLNGYTIFTTVGDPSISGSSSSGDGGAATAASMYGPAGMWTDAGGNLYIGETYPGLLRRVDAETNIITTFASGLGYVYNIWGDTLGTVYASSYSNHYVYSITSQGEVSISVGIGYGASSGDGGVASSAAVNSPMGVWGDSLGQVFIAEYSGGRVRKVTGVSSRTITTIIGGGLYDLDNAAATSVALSVAWGLSGDSVGNIFVAEFGASRVRKFSSESGLISTVCPSGTFSSVISLFVDESGGLFVGNYGGYNVKYVYPGATSASIVAGNGGSGITGDYGAATSAAIGYNEGLTGDSTGSVYISQFSAGIVRKMLSPLLSPTRAPTISFSPTLEPTTVAPTTTAPTQAPTCIPTFVPTAIPSTRIPTLSFAPTTEINGYSIRVFAGSKTYGAYHTGDGNPATSAGISYPVATWGDTLGNVYIAELSNGYLRKVAASSTVISSIYTGLANVYCMWGNSAGVLYASDWGYSRVYSVSESGSYITVAGGGSSGDGVSALAASVNQPMGVWENTLGSLYIAEYGGNKVRKVAAMNSDGVRIITTIAGGGSLSTSTDEIAATSVVLSLPWGLYGDSVGNVYVTQYSGGKVNKIDTSRGLISNIGGAFNGPISVWASDVGEVFVGELNGIRICQVISFTCQTIAGTGVSGSSGDGGPATSALISSPYGLWGDSLGNMYISEYGNSIVRVLSTSRTWPTRQPTISLTPTVSPTTAMPSMSPSLAPTYIINGYAINTIVGDYSLRGTSSGDNGLAINAGMRNPVGLWGDPSGNLYISDITSAYVRKVDKETQIIKSFSTQLSSVYSLWGDSLGIIYASSWSACKVYTINSAGAQTVFAGSGGSSSSGDGYVSTLASLGYPMGVWGDSLGSVYIAEYAGQKIRKVTTSVVQVKTISTIAGGGYQTADDMPATSSYLSVPWSLCGDSVGNLYLTDYQAAKVRKISTTTGFITSLAPGSWLSVIGIWVDSSGGAYVGNYGAGNVKYVAPGSTSAAIIVGGGSHLYSGDGGPATSAGVGSVQNIWGDSTGAIFLSETSSGVVRKLTSTYLFPTVSPTVSRSPTSLRPTAFPTFRPTKAPIRVNFNCTQTLNGISSKAFLNLESNSRAVFISTLSATLTKSASVSMVTVVVLSASDSTVDTRRRLRVGDLPMLSVASMSDSMHEVLDPQDRLRRDATGSNTHMSLFADSSTVVVSMISYTMSTETALSVNSSYYQVTGDLTNSINSGAFTSLLHQTAINAGNLDLVSATASGATYTRYTSSADTAMPSFSPTRFPTGTAVPSFKPSARPTSTVAPSYLLTAQNISLVRVLNITKTSFRVSAIFDSATNYAGYLYCAAVLPDTSITSTDQIVTSAFSTSYLLGSTSASVTIGNLAAVTKYDIYCYVQSTLGYGSTLSQMLATKQTNSTACCNEIKFSNALTSVYSDVTQYAKSPVSSYVFTYSLSTAPNSSLTIRPIVTMFPEGTVISPLDLAVVPTSRTFTFSSPNMIGSFFLSGSGSLSRVVGISLQISGPNSNTFSSAENIFVKVIANSASVPPPILSYCRLSNSGAFAYIVFDSATDRAGITSTSWMCSELFTFNGASSAPCSWVNSTVVRIVFSGNAINQLKVGDTVSVTAGKLKAACFNDLCERNEYSASWTVNALIPSNPVTPTVQLRIPSVVVLCTSITFDATTSSGNGGRLWEKVSWTASTTSNSDTSALLAYLESYGKSINQLISIPASVFEDTRYTVSLTVTNFFGISSTQSVDFTVSYNPNVPDVTIVGPSVVTVKPSQPLTLYQYATLTSCASSVAITYSWSIYRNNILQTSITSASLEPRTLILAKYSLQSRSVYTAVGTATVPDLFDSSVFVSASASVTIQVTQGDVIAVVKGGYVRSLSIPTTLVLDASGSYDEDATTSQLYFQWSCSIVSTSNYSASCNEAFGSNSRTSSVLTLSGLLLKPSVQYGFEVVVSAADGRSSSRLVTVQNLYDFTSAIPSSVTYIESSETKFNSDAQLTLFGYFNAPYAATAQWTATESGKSVAFTSLTQQVRSFRTADASNQISYPLAIPGGTFIAGSVITFRLSANKQDETSLALYSYAEITLTVNSPPSSGLFSISPSIGTAITTAFAMISTGWVDDFTDYPLTFDFTYTRMASQPALSIKTRDTLNSIQSSLPAGYESLNFGYDVTCHVYDSLLASSSTIVFVTVAPQNASFNVNGYLSSNLPLAIATGDSSSAVQVINNAASVFNSVNCSLITTAYCASLNRASCSDTANTCSSCLSGYIGVVGASNTLCFNAISNAAKVVGDNCTESSECLFGQCETIVTQHSDGNDSSMWFTSSKSICTEPQLMCPTVESNTTCSGHGSCSYLDPSGNSLASCVLSDVHCIAKCSCANGYGGADCSLTPDELSVRDADRRTLCEAIISVASTANPSVALLETLVGSLLVSYDPLEIVSTSAQVTCSQALTVVATLASEGYLFGATGSTLNSIVETASKYAQSSVNDTSFSLALVDAVTSLTSGIFESMVNGQDPVKVVTDNLQLTVVREVTSSLANATLSPPLTEDNIAFGGLAPSVQFNGDALSACDDGSGYTQFSVVSWGNNPYANSTALKSPLLGTNSYNAAGTSRRRQLVDHKDFDLAYAPAYYLTFQFSTEQNFFADSDPLLPGVQLNNETFPLCRMFDGEKYVPCSDCSVVTFTNFNVTFGCRDISQLCSSSSERRLYSKPMNQYVEHVLHGDQKHRILFDDDQTTAGSTNAEQFGVIFGALVTEISDTLSFNPFAINAAAAAPIVVFVSIMMFTVFFGMIYFARWDRSDHDRLIYIKFQERDKKRHISKIKHKSIAEIIAEKLEERRLAPTITDELSIATAKLRSSYAARKGKLLTRSTIFPAAADEPKSIIDIQNDPEYSMFYHPPLVESEKKRRTKSVDVNSSKKFAFDPIAEHDETISDLDGFFNPQDKNSFGVVSDKRSQHHSTSTVPQESDSNSSKSNPFSPFSNSSRGSSHKSSRKQLRAEDRAARSAEKTEKEAEKTMKTPAEELMDVVTAFLNEVMPSDSQYSKLDKYYQFLTALFNNHDYTAAFGSRSISNNRSMRWLKLSISILLVIFIDTLFYGVFYPDTGICETYTDATSCLATKNKATNNAACEWTSDECSFREPPSNVTFTMIVVLLTTLIAVPLQLLFDFIRTEVCSKRPEFEIIGWSSEYFVGRSSKDVDQTGQTEFELKTLYDKIDNKRDMEQQLRDYENSENAAEYYRQRIIHDNMIASKVYLDTNSPQEEAAQLIADMRVYCENYARSGNHVPWQQNDDFVAQESKMEAIRTFIGLNPDGTPLPLTFRQWIQYGDVKNRIVDKIRHAREKAVEIEDTFEQVGESNLIDRDTALIQYFILEQFSPFKRYCLRNQFFYFPVASPDSIHPVVWLTGWGFIIFVMIFFFYWIFAWCVSNGGGTFRAWGLNFVIGFIQDVLVIQIVKVYIFYIVAMDSIRSQLNYTYRMLSRVAIAYAQEGRDNKESDTNTMGVKASDIYKAIHKSSSRDGKDEYRRRAKKALDKHLSEFVAEHTHDQATIIQHMSPACRVARRIKHRDLASAKILRRVNDNDIAVCRLNSHTPIAAYALIVVAIPVVLGVVSEVLGDVVLDAFLPGFLMSFILANFVISQASVTALIILYLLGAGYFYWRLRLVPQAQERVRLMSVANGTGTVYDGVSDKEKSVRCMLTEINDRDKQLISTWAKSKRSSSKYSIGNYLTCMFHNFADKMSMLVVYGSSINPLYMRSVKSAHWRQWNNMNKPMPTANAMTRTKSSQSVCKVKENAADIVILRAAPSSSVDSQSVHNNRTERFIVPMSLHSHSFDIFGRTRTRSDTAGALTERTIVPEAVQSNSEGNSASPSMSNVASLSTSSKSPLLCNSRHSLNKRHSTKIYLPSIPDEITGMVTAGSVALWEKDQKVKEGQRSQLNQVLSMMQSSFPLRSPPKSPQLIQLSPASTHAVDPLDALECGNDVSSQQQSETSPSSSLKVTEDEWETYQEQYEVGYLTGILNEHLLGISAERYVETCNKLAAAANSGKMVNASKSAPKVTNKTVDGVAVARFPTQLYRDKHMHTSDLDEVLRRLLQKHIHRNKEDMGLFAESPTNSSRAGSFAPQSSMKLTEFGFGGATEDKNKARLEKHREKMQQNVFMKTRTMFSFKVLQTSVSKRVECCEEYLTNVGHFKDYCGSVHVDVLIEIMHDLFTYYHPKHYTLNEEEVDEALETFHTWLLGHAYVNSVVPFLAFRGFVVDFVRVFLASRDYENDIGLMRTTEDYFPSIYSSHCQQDMSGVSAVENNDSSSMDAWWASTSSSRKVVNIKGSSESQIMSPISSRVLRMQSMYEEEDLMQQQQQLQLQLQRQQSLGLMPESSYQHSSDSETLQNESDLCSIKLTHAIQRFRSSDTAEISAKSGLSSVTSLSRFGNVETPTFSDCVFSPPTTQYQGINSQWQASAMSQLRSVETPETSHRKDGSKSAIALSDALFTFDVNMDRRIDNRSSSNSSTNHSSPLRIDTNISMSQSASAGSRAEEEEVKTVSSRSVASSDLEALSKISSNDLSDGDVKQVKLTSVTADALARFNAITAAAAAVSPQQESDDDDEEDV